MIIALLTIVVFIAGFAVGWWAQTHYGRIGPASNGRGHAHAA